MRNRALNSPQATEQKERGLFTQKSWENHVEQIVGNVKSSLEGSQFEDQLNQLGKAWKAEREKCKNDPGTYRLPQKLETLVAAVETEADAEGDGDEKNQETLSSSFGTWKDKTAEKKAVDKPATGGAKSFMVSAVPAAPAAPAAPAVDKPAAGGSKSFMVSAAPAAKAASAANSAPAVKAASAAKAAPAAKADASPTGKEQSDESEEEDDEGASDSEDEQADKDEEDDAEGSEEEGEEQDEEDPDSDAEPDENGSEVQDSEAEGSDDDAEPASP